MGSVGQLPVVQERDDEGAHPTPGEGPVVGAAALPEPGSHAVDGQPRGDDDVRGGDAVPAEPQSLHGAVSGAAGSRRGRGSRGVENPVEILVGEHHGQDDLVSDGLESLDEPVGGRLGGQGDVGGHPAYATRPDPSGDQGEDVLREPLCISLAVPPGGELTTSGAQG